MTFFIFQDTFKLLFSTKSARSVGSLCHIRNFYRHTNVKADVHQSFNEATELLRFATICYVIAAALTFLKCQTMDDVPETNPGDKCLLLQNVATQVVDMCFCPPNSQPVISANITENETYKYCVCKRDTGEVMVCCENKKCKNGKWFHLSCMDIEKEDLDDVDDWFCSNQCREKPSKTTSCIPSDEDSVFQYTKVLMYRGLREMVQHNAIRANHGPKIISYWKEDLFEFYDLHHTKYFLAGHQLLTDVGGGLSERLAHDLVWNRTVNLKGGKYSNLEMDLQMEFFNREFKGDY